MDNFIKSPTDREYHLNCRVKFHRKYVHENGRSYERDLVILVPEDSDERTRFLSAWLPDSREEYFELASIMSPPIDSPCRLSVHRGPDDKSEKHYLFVMSKGVEEIILEHIKEGAIIPLKILPEGAEEILDHAVDSHGNYQLIPGQDSL